MPFPGSDFTTISGKIKAFASGARTERLLIIGTAVDGPLNLPYPIQDSSTAERVFGPVVYSNGYKDPVSGTESGKDNGATLPKAIAQALAAGCTDIWVCRATGTYAETPSAYTSKLHLKARNPGRIYNEVSLSLTSTGGVLGVQLTQPSTKGETFVVSFASTVTIGDFIDRLNGDRRNKTLTIVKDTWSSYLSAACTTLVASASGLVTTALNTGVSGTNGTSAQGEDYATTLDGYATKLTTEDTGTFDSLLGQAARFNVCVLTGIHLDDQVVTSGNSKPQGGTWTSAEEYQTTIATDFVYWLDKVSSTIAPCHGVIACRPPFYQSETKVIDWVRNSLLTTTAAKWDANLRWNKAGYFLYTGWTRIDANAGEIDLGARLSVVAGPDVVFALTGLGNYSDMWHVAYAAMLTTIPPERAPIFKAVPGIVAYGTPIPTKYCNKLVEGVGFDANTDLSGQGAYVCLTRNPRDPLGPMVVFDDVTVTARDDFMRNYQLVHLCNNMHHDLDAALSGFLGGPTNAATLAAMETVVQNVMDGYVNSNALRGKRGAGYDFKITMNGTDAALGIVRIHLEIAPATALRKIYFVVAVRQSA